MSGPAVREDPPVTVMMSRRVKPGREPEFEEFVSGITETAARFEGHMGADIFRPGPGEDEWRVVFKFDRESNLKKWEASEERKAWYAHAEGLARDEPKRRIATGLETWFTLPGQKAITPPPRYKMALITWVAVFPLITVLFAVLSPVLEQLPLVARTLVVTAVMVPAMTYAIMPGMSRIFKRWLYPPPDHASEEAPDGPATEQPETKHPAEHYTEQSRTQRQPERRAR